MRKYPSIRRSLRVSSWLLALSGSLFAAVTASALQAPAGAGGAGTPVPVAVASDGLEVGAPHFSRPVVFSGEGVNLTLPLTNTGATALSDVSVDLVAPPDVLLDPPAGASSPIPAHETIRRVWRLSAEKAAAYPLAVHWHVGQHEGQVSVAPLLVCRPPRGLDTREEQHPGLAPDADGNFIFKNGYLVAVLLKTDSGYGPLLLYPATRATQVSSSPAAVVPLLATIHWVEGNTSHFGAFTPGAAVVAKDNTLLLTGSVKDGSSTTWAAELDLSLGTDQWLSWTARVHPAGDAGLTRFAPMPVRAGEEGNRDALFPGLEYLTGAETSSDSKDDHSASHLRLVPDPYQITVPLMSVTQKGTTVALLWNNQQLWGGPGYPSALFDSPNRGEEQGNTRMELFLPSVPRFVHPNSEVAADPLALHAGQEVSLSGKLVIDREQENPATAIRRWEDAYGSAKPEAATTGPAKAPRTKVAAEIHRLLEEAHRKPAAPAYFRPLDAERALCREAYTRTAWDAAGHKWRYPSTPAPNAPSPAPFGVLALRMDAGLSTLPGERNALLAQAWLALADLQKQGNIPPRLAYRVGGVLPGIDLEREHTDETIRRQLAGGGWAWLPTTPAQESLGEAGTVDLGTVTAAALPVFRYAVRTGDSEAAAAGENALSLIDVSFRVPRGGQTWDVPLHAPDLLSAAEATECFLLGYQVSGEERYLEGARWWATSGLPFIYLWGDPGKPALRGAAIRAFGAANYTEPLYGKPAQWCGLEYAHVLQALCRVRPDDFLEKVARSILESAMQQQDASGASGLLPEYWNVAQNRGEGQKLLPEWLLATLYREQEMDTDISHIRLQVGPDRMFVASGARIVEGLTSATRMWLTLRSPKGLDTFLTIEGVPAKPLSIQYNSKWVVVPGIGAKRMWLPESENESQEGWYYDGDDTFLILRLPHTRKDDHLEILWPDSKDRLPIRRVEPKTDPARQ